MMMLGANQCVKTWHPCLWLVEWTQGSLCGRPFAGVCQHLRCVPCSLGRLLHGYSVSECVVMSSGCIGRMRFPYLSIRREASVTCGTPNTGRCKQTPCKGENRRMKTDVQTWRSVPKVLGLEKPSPLAPVERCPDRADPLASFAGSHVRVTQARSSNMNRVGSGGWQLRSRSQSRADLGSCEGCGESVPSTPSLPGFAGHGGCVWA